MPNFLPSNDLVFFIITLVIAVLALVVSRKLLKVSFPYFFMGLLGLIIGLAIGALVSSPLSQLPGIWGRWLPIIFDVFVVVAFLDLFLAQTKPVAEFFQKIFRRFSRITSSRDWESNEIFVDTSVLIDARIVDIVRTGFIFGRLIIPRFILNELQQIADSTDPVKRAKGQRGLESLTLLRKTPNIKLEISEDELKTREKIDAKLVKVARKRKARILTVDYNLNQIAQIQDVPTLNINELATSLRPEMVPGEFMIVKVIQKGKEKGQGVGYLPDGTMIVVEEGEDKIGKTIECEVIRIFQTVAGKMIFVKPRE